MKRIVIGLLMAAALLAQGQVHCIVDNMMCVFTGKTQIVSGVMLKQYRCPNGHLQWAR